MQIIRDCLSASDLASALSAHLRRSCRWRGGGRWGSGQFMWFMCETANLAKRGASLKAENVKLEANSSIYSTWQHAVDLSPLIHNQSILIQRCQVTRQFRTIDEPRRCADEEAVRALEGWQSWLRWQTAPYSPFISHCLIWLVGSAQVGHSKSKAGSAKIKKGLSFYHGVPFFIFFFSGLAFNAILQCFVGDSQYFYNAFTGESSWENPAEVAQHKCLTCSSVSIRGSHRKSETSSSEGGGYLGICSFSGHDLHTRATHSSSPLYL